MVFSYYIMNIVDDKKEQTAQLSTFTVSEVITSQYMLNILNILYCNFPIVDSWDLSFGYLSSL